MKKSKSFILKKSKEMKKRALSLGLMLVLCFTFTSVNQAATTVNSKAISVGDVSMAITENGDLYSWGYNAFGQVGNDKENYIEDLPVKVLADLVSVTRAAGVVAAITTNGDLYSWGSFTYADTTTRTKATEVVSATPLKLLSNVASVTAEIQGTISVTMYATTTSGDLYSWGYNGAGQVGDGNGGQSLFTKKPVKVLSNVTSFKANNGTVAAIDENDDLYAWGENKYGQVGNGKMGKDAYQTTPIKILSNVASLTSNDGPLAAITQNGDLYCWGSNWFGQVGNDTKDHQTKPVKVLSDVVAVKKSSNMTAAVTKTGDLYCWGYNEQGQVGNGTIGASADQPTPMKILSDVAWFNVTIVNTAAITEKGDLYVWGSNGFGQVGNDSKKDQPSPVKILSDVVSLTSAGGYNSAAITTNGDLYCWGYNNFGQVGNNKGGTPDTILAEGEIQKTPVKVLSKVATVMTNSKVTGAVTENGDLYCWGNNGYGQVGKGERSVEKFQTTPIKVLSEIRGSNGMTTETAVETVPTVVTTPATTATPTASKVMLDGKSVSFDAYNINENNYFKLRDLAYVLNTSTKQFSITWDGVNNSIVLNSGQPYTSVGGEMAINAMTDVTPVPTTSKMSLDGKVIDFKAYTIGENNYFKLRDVGIAFDFNVSWNGPAETIEIDTAGAYTND